MGGTELKDLNNITRDALIRLMQTKGIDAADQKIKELILQCENNKGDTRDRSTIKGELSEVALECHLLYWMERLQYLAVVKSLCIKSQVSNATAEIDIMLVTPCRVYLFECKSFKGSKTLTKECYLQGGSSSKDVYEQSKYHLQILEQYFGRFRFPSTAKVSPYQLILFELSSDDVQDLREPKWRKNIPVLTMNTLDEWLLTELKARQEVQWNYAPLVEEIAQLNEHSSQMFKYHMAKIYNRKKG